MELPPSPEVDAPQDQPETYLEETLSGETVESSPSTSFLSRLMRRLTRRLGSPRVLALKALLLLSVYGLGLFSGYFAWNFLSEKEGGHDDMAALMEQINPAEGHAIHASFGTTGPHLLSSGAIDLEQFIQVYEQAGQPLTEEQLAILTEGSSEEIVITKENSYFLLNFFWALGVVNKNSILTEGPIVEYSKGEVMNFASTGGWTIGSRPTAELYASTEIIRLTPEQQARVEEVALGVYRPCCNNPTLFPDCNHGMAMLGLLQLMASQGASLEEMFEAAMNVNAFWFPQQNLELALYFKADQKIDYKEVTPRLVVSGQYSSGSGSQAVRQWLASSGSLQQAPSQGGSCGV